MPTQRDTRAEARTTERRTDSQAGSTSPATDESAAPDQRRWAIVSTAGRKTGQTLHRRGDCSTLHSATDIVPKPVDAYPHGEWCGVCAADVDPETATAMVWANPNTQNTGKANIVHPDPSCRHVTAKSAHKSLAVYPEGHFQWCTNCAGDPTVGRRPGLSTCDDCGTLVGDPGLDDGLCIGCQDESRPAVTDGGPVVAGTGEVDVDAPHTATVTLHRSPAPDGVDDLVFADFADEVPDRVGDLQGAQEWVETKLLETFDRDGNAHELLYTERQREWEDADAPEVATIHHDGEQVLALEVHNEALDKWRPVATDGGIDVDHDENCAACGVKPRVESSRYCAGCREALVATDGGIDVDDVGVEDGEGTPLGEADSTEADSSVPDDAVGQLDLTAFQTHILVILSEEPQYGLAVKRALEDYYDAEVNHGRLYPNLDDLVELGLVEKSPLDKRTNQYKLTAAGHDAVRDRLGWILERYVTDTDRVDDVHALLEAALEGDA